MASKFFHKSEIENIFTFTHTVPVTSQQVPGFMMCGVKRFTVPSWYKPSVSE